MANRNGILALTLALMLSCQASAGLLLFAPGSDVQPPPTDVSAIPGATVSVPIYLTGSGSTDGFTVEITYDTSVLSLPSAENCADVTIGSLNSDWYKNANTLTAGDAFVALAGALPISDPTSGTVLNVLFHVNGEAPLGPTAIGLVNCDDFASFTMVSGSIEIAEPSGVPVYWTGLGSATWSTATGLNNWKDSSGATAAYADGVEVTFDDRASGTAVDINAATVASTSVTFNNSIVDFSVTGASFGIGGAATVLKQGTGTVTMSSANSYTGLTTLENGKLVLQAGAKTPVLSGAGVDVKFGKLVLDYNDSGTSPTAVDTAMKASYTGSAWAGGKFQCSTATTANTLGWKANTGTKEITVAYTLYGDANVDGSVNLSDLGFLGDNYGLTTGATWAMGDFNYDGKVNLSDLGFLGDQYGGHVAGFITSGPVGGNPAPEPGTLVLLAAASVGLGVYGARRRKPPSDSWQRTSFNRNASSGSGGGRLPGIGTLPSP